MEINVSFLNNTHKQRYSEIDASNCTFFHALSNEGFVTTVFIFSIEKSVSQIKPRLRNTTLALQ